MKVYELCPHCEKEVGVKIKKAEPQIVTCPNCGYPLLLCAQCDYDDNDCSECEFYDKCNELTEKRKEYDYIINSHIVSCLSNFCDMRDAQELSKALTPLVYGDVVETSDFPNFNDCDIELALMRVLKSKLGVDD